MVSVISCLRSTLTCILMGLTSYFGSLILQGLFLWLSMVSFKAYRKLMDILMYMWICSTVTFMEYVGGVKFRMYGDEIRSSDRAVIIMNHRTRLDWLYLYIMMLRFGSCVYDEKIVLKDELKWVPGPGWAMQSGMYIFLVRKLKNDRLHVINVINYLKKCNGNYKLLLFPEGTDFNETSQGKSNKFADQNGLPRYEQVLHPRAPGFNLLVQQMMNSENGSSDQNFELDAIYDITVGYPEPNFAMNEIGLLTGKTSIIDFHCKRFSLKEVFQQNRRNYFTNINTTADHTKDSNRNNVTNTESSFSSDSSMNQDRVLEKFLRTRWQLKETILAKYYTDAGKDFMNIPSCATRVNLDSVNLLWKRSISILVILGNVVVCLWFLIFCQYQLYYCMFMAVFVGINCLYLVIGRVYGGVDKFVMMKCLGNEYILY